MTRLEVAKQFVEGKQGKCHNSKTDGTTYWLHGHPIAHKVGGSVIVSWCGWHTRTTAAHINAIAQAYGSDKRFSYAQARDKGEDNAML